MLQKVRSKLELTGSFVAILCAIHCISIPLLLSIGSIGAVELFDHVVVEILFLVTTLTIASWSLITSYRQSKVNMIPLLLFLFGFVALIISITVHLHVLSAVGGILIASAHYFNWRQLGKACSVEASC